MRRRQFIRLLGGAGAVWPVAALAQQPAMPIVGFLGPAPAIGYASRLNSIRAGLRDFGFEEHNNFALELRWADSGNQLRKLAADLVQLRPNVIVTTGNAATLAAKLEAGTIPIVFAVADDPVRLGIVASFNQPGGNASGVSMISGALGAKRIALLRELVPDATLIIMLANPDNPAEANGRDEQAQAEAIGQRLLVLHASKEDDLQRAFAKAAQEHANAILVNADAFFTSQREKIVKLAAQYKLPAMYAWREFTDDGGLMSYGISLGDAYRQLGIYVGRILRGVKPADLPVIQPTKIELTINLNSAKSLGLEIPAKLLALADAVIE